MTKKEFENRFNIKLSESGLKNKISIELEGDENDGDYIKETAYIDLENFEEYLSVIKAIYEGKLKNSGECMTKEEIEFLEKIKYGEDIYYDITPKGNYGCHDIGIEELKFFDENGIGYDITF